MGYEDRFAKWLSEQAYGIVIQDLAYRDPPEMLSVVGDWELRDGAFAFMIVEGGLRTITVDSAKFVGDDWELTSSISGAILRVTHWWRDDQKTALQSWSRSRDATWSRINIDGFFEQRSR